jgi:hypothetical protein
VNIERIMDGTSPILLAFNHLVTGNNNIDKSPANVKGIKNAFAYTRIITIRTMIARIEAVLNSLGYFMLKTIKRSYR